MKTKFLIADDDADDANLFCEALSEIAPVMECYQVGNGRQVFELLAENQFIKPDVIFLDINMPIMNGWDCLKKLKSNPDLNKIPTIVYSTSSAKQDINKAYDLGALLFLSKPEDFDELRSILEIVAMNTEESLLGRLRGFGSVKLS